MANEIDYTTPIEGADSNVVTDRQILRCRTKRVLASLDRKQAKL